MGYITILWKQVHLKRSVVERDASVFSENDNSSHLLNTFKPPIVRKSKLVVVDLAGSERIQKSGARHFCFSLFII